jgi:hypothetical protein
MKEALEKLVTKLDIVHSDPKYMGVWELSQHRFGPYSGATYKDEFMHARQALAEYKGD